MTFSLLCDTYFPTSVALYVHFVLINCSNRYLLVAKVTISSQLISVLEFQNVLSTLIFGDE